MHAGLFGLGSTKCLEHGPFYEGRDKIIILDEALKFVLIVKKQVVVKSERKTGQ